MTVIGFHCSHEQIDPAQLLKTFSMPKMRASPPACPPTISARGAPGRANRGSRGSFLGAALATTALPDLLDGLSEHAPDTGGGIELSVPGYGYRWLWVRRPQDEPVI